MSMDEFSLNQALLDQVFFSLNLDYLELDLNDPSQVNFRRVLREVSSWGWLNFQAKWNLVVC